MSISFLGTNFFAILPNIYHFIRDHMPSWSWVFTTGLGRLLASVSLTLGGIHFFSTFAGGVLWSTLRLSGQIPSSFAGKAGDAVPGGLNAVSALWQDSLMIRTFDFLNTYMPLEEAASSAVNIFALWVILIGYKLVKGWLPVGGS